MAKRRLGRGIDALLQGKGLEQMEQLDTVVEAPLSSLHPNPDQPRKTFSEESLAELADSIRSQGIIQPILVEAREDGHYTIIAGERRFRAAGMAGLDDVPIIVRELDNQQKLEIALIENIQREDLNPVEEAQAYKSLMEHTGATQEELSKRLGKSRSAIANTLRLLKLPSDMRDAISSGRLSAGHARALLSAATEDARRSLFDSIMSGGLTVRDAEAEVARSRNGSVSDEEAQSKDTGNVERKSGAHGTGSAGSSGGAEATKTVEMREIEQKLIEALGTRVVLKGSNARGQISIQYLSMDDLDRITDVIASHTVLP